MCRGDEQSAAVAPVAAQGGAEAEGAGRTGTTTRPAAARARLRGRRQSGFDGGG